MNKSIILLFENKGNLKLTDNFKVNNLKTVAAQCFSLKYNLQKQNILKRNKKSSQKKSPNYRSNTNSTLKIEVVGIRN